MKILAICDSPRKGNTEFILKRILTKAETLGAKTELVLLREKRIELAADWTEMPLVGGLYLVGEGHQDIENNPENIQKIDEFTKGLVN